jgi:hypothetical protein
MSNLFTPWNAINSAERASMTISDADKAKTGSRKLPWQAEITDLNSGKRYLVRGCACTIPRCHCDAEIIRECKEIAA